MAKRLTTEQIIGRLKLGSIDGQFMSQFARNDIDMCRRFLDVSPLPLYVSGDTGVMNMGPTGEDIPVQIPQGQTTGLMSNVIIKMAAMTINDPDYHVVASKPSEDGSVQNDNNCAQICRQFLKDEWDKKNWKRVAQRVYQKLCVAGLGCAAYSWIEDENYGVKWEHVQSWDLCVDPFMTDWQTLEWGGKRIRMSLRKAAERYPKASFAKTLKTLDSAAADSEKIDVWVYWDKQTEAHIYDSELLNPGDLDNKYGVVPFLFMEGIPHPGRSQFPLGDMLLASGPEQEVADLTQYISNVAKNGGAINCYDPEGMDKGVLEKLEKGEQQAWLAIKGLEAVTRPPFYRLPPEELSSSVLEAKRNAENYRDGIVGIGEYDRGVAENQPKFATEVYAAMSRGGARRNQAQSEYEIFMDRWAKITVTLTKEFGGPYEKDGQRVSTSEQEALWEALQNVTEIRTLEGSTAYRDPSMEQQQSMQLAQLALSAMPMLLNLTQLGLVKKLPDMEKLFNRCFMAFGVNNTEQFWVDPPQQMPNQQGGKPPIENINYKDAPEDVRRQMEQQAGLQPSQIGGSVEDQGQGPEMIDHTPHLVDLEKQKRDHQFQLHSQVMKQIHEIGLKNADLQNQRQIASEQAQNQYALAQSQQKSQQQIAKLSKVNNNGNNSSRGRSDKRGS